MNINSLAEKTGIAQKALEDIYAIAENYKITRLLLFGSRARGTYQEKSDIDIAVYGCRNFIDFIFDMEENVWTLLEFDLINMDEPTVSQELKDEIRRDGVLLYEKV